MNVSAFTSQEQLQLSSSNMDTPPHEDMLMQGRRSTRSALAEIPVRLDMLSVDENGRLPLVTATNDDEPGRWHLNMSINVPNSLISPSPSPDEMIIQQRGRRRIPVTWSPDNDRVKDNGPHTPVKCACSPSKSSIVLRSTPRKRLMLNDPKELFGTPEKLRKMQMSPKKNRPERIVSSYLGPLETTLQALSQEQLIGIIQMLVQKHVDLEEEIKESLPVPDIRPFEERLNYLKKNIYKSLPNSRLTSKTDSPAYSRASTHVLAFKKCVLDQGRQLVSSQNWGAVLDYVFLAWGYVRATPLWDNPPHNAARRQCFKSLAAQCMTALKRGSWSSKQCEIMEQKLDGLVCDSEDIHMCIKYINSIKKKV